MVKLGRLCVGVQSALLFVFSLANTGVQAQSPAPAEPTLRVFHLKYVREQNDANEVLVALRNALDARNKMYLVNHTSDIVLSAPPDQVALAARLIDQLDRPRASYRLTFSLTDSDSGKRIGLQHFSMLVLDGQRVVLKQGDKVPVVTGSFETDKAAQQTQVTYLDVGVNLDATLDLFASGLRLKSKVEISSVADPPNGGKLADDPIVRQSMLEGTSVIVPGKPTALGGIDIVGSTRHVDVEVLAEPLP